VQLAGEDVVGFTSMFAQNAASIALAPTWGSRPRLYDVAPSGLARLRLTGDFDGTLAETIDRGTGKA